MRVIWVCYFNNTFHKILLLIDIEYINNGIQL